MNKKKERESFAAPRWNDEMGGRIIGFAKRAPEDINKDQKNFEEFLIKKGFLKKGEKIIRP